MTGGEHKAITMVTVSCAQHSLETHVRCPTHWQARRIGATPPPYPLSHGAVLEQELHCHWDELQELVPEADDHSVQVLPHSRVQRLPLNRHLQATQEDGQGLGVGQEVEQGGGAGGGVGRWGIIGRC